MFDDAVCDIQLSSITIWPPGTMHKAGEAVRKTVTAALVAVSLGGIAMGFAATLEQPGSSLQVIAFWVAIHAGLIG
jgi:hypothetical protein